MPTGMAEDNFIFFMHPDHLGSTSFVTDRDGGLYEHVAYFPYGETWVEQASDTEDIPYLFTGKELDQETGLYYFGARYYDPRTSVWESSDPLLMGIGGGRMPTPTQVSSYLYARGNPLRYMDPTGLDGEESGPSGFWSVLIDVFHALAPATSSALGPGDRGALQGMPPGMGEFYQAANQEVAQAGAKAGGAIVDVGSIGLSAQMVVSEAAVGAAASSTLAGPARLIPRQLVETGAEQAAKGGAAVPKGNWVPAAESMSERAAAYQNRFGRAGQVYRLNGVKFDGVANGVLQEAKGPGYAKFVRDGAFRPWYRGSEALVSQAQRQVAAAGGAPIEWHFAEETAAKATEALFKREGITGVKVLYTP